jgi:hypothetical protein
MLCRSKKYVCVSEWEMTARPELRFEIDKCDDKIQKQRVIKVIFDSKCMKNAIEFENEHTLWCVVCFVCWLGTDQRYCCVVLWENLPNNTQPLPSRERDNTTNPNGFRLRFWWDVWRINRLVWLSSAYSRAFSVSLFFLLTINSHLFLFVIFILSIFFTEYDNVAQPESDFSDLLPIGTVIQSTVSRF